MSKHPETKILFTSGYAGDSVGLRKELGERVPFIQKPYELEHLARKMLRDFPRVRHHAETSDVLQGAVMRLLNSLREIQPASRCCPSRSASVIAPTLDERARISATVIVSVPRGSASWMIRSATWISYGRTKLVAGETRPSESAPATVTSLNVEPGS